MRHWIISLVAFVLACIGTLCGLLVVTDQGRASADLDNSFVTCRADALGTVFSHPLPNADPYFEPRMLSWQRRAWGYPRPCLVRDSSPDGRFYYAKLEGGVALQNLVIFFIPCWLMIEVLSFLCLRRRPSRTARRVEDLILPCDPSLTSAEVRRMAYPSRNRLIAVPQLRTSFAIL